MQSNGPIVVCVINMKGGVGKSTIAALLARHAFRKKKDILAIDLDPQANLSQALMGESYKSFVVEGRPSIVEIFNGYVPPSKAAGAPTSLSQTSGVELLSTFGGVSLELIPSRFDFSDNLVSALRPDPKVLARFIADKFGEKDIIIIDCAPTESVLTYAAYHASRLVLVPVKPEFFATIGFPLLRESLHSFRSKNKSHDIDVVGIVVNNGFYDGGNDGGPEKYASLQDIRKDAKKNGWKIYEHEIPFSRGFPKLMRGDYSYPGNAAYFYQFANEFFDDIGL